MKKGLILITILFNASAAISQVTYQVLDSLSTLISKFQKSNHGQTYSCNDGSQYTLSFAEGNFQVFSHNRMASFSEYRKYGDTEKLYLTENIDLSKATALEASTGNGQSIKLLFPAGHLKTDVYENGNLVETLSPEYLEFYLLSEFNLSMQNLYGQKFKTIAALCHLLQLEKGMIDEAYIKNVNKSFEHIVNNLSGKSLSIYEKFFNDYKNRPVKSLYYNEVNLWYTFNKKQVDQAIHFADSICNVYQFKPNLSKSEFLSYNKTAASTELKSFYSENAFAYPTTSYYVDVNYKKHPNIYVKGFSGYITNNAGKVISYGWFLEDEKLPYTHHQQVFEKIKQSIIKAVPSYLTFPKKKAETDQIERIVVWVPNRNKPDETGYYITYKLMSVNGSHNILINFSTERAIAEW